MLNDDAINRLIHEKIIGECWHISGRHRSGIADGICTKCGLEEIISSLELGNIVTTNWERPSYTSSLDAVAKVEVKVLNDPNLVQEYGKYLAAQDADACAPYSWRDIGYIATLPPRKRCEAILRATGHWPEGE